MLVDFHLSALLLLSGYGHRLHKRALSLGVTPREPNAYQVRLLSHFTEERSGVLQLLQLDLKHRVGVDEVVSSFTHVIEHLDQSSHRHLKG